jgi:hypothetical protein
MEISFAGLRLALKSLMISCRIMKFIMDSVLIIPLYQDSQHSTDNANGKFEAILG